MKNKKSKPLLQPMGGIEIKYDKQIKDLTIGATAVLFSSLQQIAAWEKDGGVRDHVCDWLNGPLKVFNKIESDLGALVAEVMTNPEFSEQGKEKFQQSFVSMMNETLARARGLDHYVMTGELPFGEGGER